MPYAVTQEERDKQKQAGGSNVPVLSGQTGNIAALPSGGAPGVAGQPSRSGSWSNIQAYIQGNKAGGEQMANRTAEQISKPAEAGLAGLQQAQQQFGQQVQQGSIKPNQALIGSVMANPGAATQEQQGGFRSMLNAVYGGPKTLSQVAPYNEAVKNIQSAQTASEMSKTAPGQQTMLGQAYARPTYTSGEKGLDTAIMRQTPSALGIFENVRGLYKDIGDKRSAAEKAAAEQAGTAEQQTAAARQQAESALTGRAGQVTGAAQGRINDILRQRSIDDSLAKAALDAQQEYGLSKGQYFSPDTGKIGMVEATTPEELAQLRALSSLAGERGGELLGSDAQTVLANAENVGKIGKGTFKEADYQSALGARKAAYNQQTSGIINDNSQPVSARLAALDSIIAQYGGVITPEVAQAQSDLRRLVGSPTLDNPTYRANNSRQNVNGQRPDDEMVAGFRRNRR